MVESNIDPSGRQRFAQTLSGALFVAAAGVSYFSIRDSWAIPARPNESASAYAVAPPSEVLLPPGPHRTEFQASCMICHSARLALNQPTFPQEKWAEIVHKMAAVYGGPIAKEDEGRIVEYLLAAQAAR